MTEHVSVRIELNERRDEPNPARRFPVLVPMDQRVAGSDEIACDRDLLVGKVDGEVAARMRIGDMDERHLDAIDRVGFAVLGNDLVRQILFGRRAASAGGERLLHLLLVVLVGDDRDAFRKRRKPVDVVSIAVGQDDRRDRLIGELADFVDDSFSGFQRRLHIDHGYAVLADDDAGISPAALDEVDVVLDLLEGQRLVRRLSESERAQCGQSCNESETENGISYWHGILLL